MQSESNAPTRTNWQKITFNNGNGTTTNSNRYSYTDKYLNNIGKYFYRLKIKDFNGKFEYSPEIEVDFYTPAKFNLAQNYPNPFNSSTVINFELAKKCNVMIKIYDALGNEVQNILNEERPAGNHKLEFRETNLASVFYFYKIITPDFMNIKKMILLK
jgi:hypothetical protein